VIRDYLRKGRIFVGNTSEYEIRRQHQSSYWRMRYVYRREWNTKGNKIIARFFLSSRASRNMENPFMFKYSTVITTVDFQLSCWIW